MNAAMFGSRELAGPFAGAGILLGSNAGAWEQANAARCFEWQAVTPANLFEPMGRRQVVWQPPEQTQASPVELVRARRAAGWIGQAENQGEYDAAIAASRTHELTVRRGLIVNSWLYGPLVRGVHRWRHGWVAMPELFVNVQANLAEWEYICGRYVAAGARCVVPVLGGWSNDNDAPAVYAAMRGRFPGVLIAAEEDELTPEVLRVARSLP